jgi:hypothetical protein
MAQYDDLNTRQIWIVGIISAVLTAVTILAVQVLYFALLNWHDEAKLADAEYFQSISHIQQQERGMQIYGRNAESGAYEIPISVAMELVADRSEKGTDQVESEEDKSVEDEESI